MAARFPKFFVFEILTPLNCDHILMVDNGRIAEEGTYDELVRRQMLESQ